MVTVKYLDYDSIDHPSLDYYHYVLTRHQNKHSIFSTTVHHTSLINKNNLQWQFWCYLVVYHHLLYTSLDRDEWPPSLMEYQRSLVDYQIQVPMMNRKCHRHFVVDCIIEDHIVVHYIQIQVKVYVHRYWHEDWSQSFDMDNEKKKMNNPIEDEKWDTCVIYERLHHTHRWLWSWVDDIS
jgi:hypothetical protein